MIILQVVCLASELFDFNIIFMQNSKPEIIFLISESGSGHPAVDPIDPPLIPTHTQWDTGFQWGFLLYEQIYDGNVKFYFFRCE